MNRGDIVLVPFPFQDKLGEKIRRVKFLAPLITLHP